MSVCAGGLPSEARAAASGLLRECGYPGRDEIDRGALECLADVMRSRDATELLRVVSSPTTPIKDGDEAHKKLAAMFAAKGEQVDRVLRPCLDMPRMLQVDVHVVPCIMKLLGAA